MSDPKHIGYVNIRDLSPGNVKEGFIPIDRAWTFLWGHIKFATTNTPGSRLLVMQLNLPLDPDPLARTWAPSAQGPNNVTRYQFFPGHAGIAGEHTGEVVFMPLPAVPLMLGGWKFKVSDVNNVDPNDHMEIRCFVMKEERI